MEARKSDRVQGSVRPRVAVLQDGARRRYALPTALHREGLLETMYCDWFVRRGSLEQAAAGLAKIVAPAAARRLRGRSNSALDDARVVTKPSLVLRQAMAARRFGTSNTAAYYHWVSRQIGDWVGRHGFGKANALLGFIRNVDPALLGKARQCGLRTVGDQIIAPAAIEIAEARRMADRFPGWQNDVETAELTPFVEWEQRTWDQLDRIICMSSYVRDGLIAQGVPESRLSLIPYPLDAKGFHVADRSAHKGDLTVGFVGAVNLRKGAPYFLETASRLAGRGVRFVMVGSCHADEKILAEHRGAVELIGRVQRDQVQRRLNEFDIFFFPSTCEGSAGAVVEAMACGLPIVTTPNSGSPVRDGIDGFVLDNGDVEGFTAAIDRLLTDRDLRLAMGQSARRRIESYSLEWYSHALADLFWRELNGEQG